jgi:hypothetical protein
MGRLGTFTDPDARPVKMISERQLPWLQDLTRQLFDLTAEITGDDVTANREAALSALEDLTSREASAKIDELRNDLLPTLRRTRAATPRTTMAVPAPELDRKALYMLDGQVYRVRLAGPTARRAGELYALVLNTGTREFDYLPGAYDVAAKITPDHKMTAEQARTFGDVHAWCARCGADLSDPKSIAQGMGPTCIKYQR